MVPKDYPYIQNRKLSSNCKITDSESETRSLLMDAYQSPKIQTDRNSRYLNPKIQNCYNGIHHWIIYNQTHIPSIYRHRKFLTVLSSVLWLSKSLLFLTVSAKIFCQEPRVTFTIIWYIYPSDFQPAGCEDGLHRSYYHVLQFVKLSVWLMTFMESKNKQLFPIHFFCHSRNESKL